MCGAACAELQYNRAVNGTSVHIDYRYGILYIQDILPLSAHPLKSLETFHGGCSSELLLCISCHNYMQNKKQQWDIKHKAQVITYHRTHGASYNQGTRIQLTDANK